MLRDKVLRFSPNKMKCAIKSGATGCCNTREMTRNKEKPSLNANTRFWKRSQATKTFDCNFCIVCSAFFRQSVRSSNMNRRWWKEHSFKRKIFQTKKITSLWLDTEVFYVLKSGFLMLCDFFSGRFIMFLNMSAFWFTDF